MFFISGLDLVVRDSLGHVLTPEETSAVDLYRQHVTRYSKHLVVSTVISGILFACFPTVECIAKVKAFYL